MHLEISSVPFTTGTYITKVSSIGQNVLELERGQISQVNPTSTNTLVTNNYAIANTFCRTRPSLSDIFTSFLHLSGFRFLYSISSLYLIYNFKYSNENYVIYQIRRIMPCIKGEAAGNRHGKYNISITSLNGFEL